MSNQHDGRLHENGGLRTGPCHERVAIVGGCGHVGLPLGMALAGSGCQVDLVDTSESRVSMVSAGRMPFHEDGADALLPQLIASGALRATTDSAAVAQASAVIVTIGTPVGDHLNPCVSDFLRVIDHMLPSLQRGAILIVRSTVFPGMTERLGRHLSERGRGDIDLCYCPERIRQGMALRELAQWAQIVAGTTLQATHRAEALFGLVCPEIVRLKPVEAELAKLFCNAWLYINYAISNQLYMLAARHDADFDRIHAGLRQGFPRMNSLARAGFAAGPCLLKDTIQLAAFNPGVFPLGFAALAINEGLPSVIVEDMGRRYPLETMTVGVLGMAFKPESDDARDSLAYKLRKVLRLACRRVLCTDPYVPDPDLVPLADVLEQADVIVVGAPHDCYRSLVIRQPVFDVTGTITSASPPLPAGGGGPAARADQASGVR